MQGLVRDNGTDESNAAKLLYAPQPSWFAQRYLSLCYSGCVCPPLSRMQIQAMWLGRNRRALLDAVMGRRSLHSQEGGCPSE
jgi:hypothetical protein